MIPVQEARSVFTQTLVATWNELIELAPKMFLGSFFTKKTTVDKEISIEVVRGTEKIAVDVLRGTQGNRNTFSKAAQKIFIPPFFNEWFDATELDKYDNVFGIGVSQVEGRVIDGMLGQALEKLNVLKYKIERAYELQCSQVFSTGIVTLVSGDNIDFKRKAASMVVKEAAEYWTVQTVDPRTHLQAGCEFLRKTGKATDGEFNAILGRNVLTALLANPFIDNDKIKTMALVDLNMPQANAMGGIYHGTISCGPYKVNLWSYPEFYETSDGAVTPYINDDYYYLLPLRSAKLVKSFAGVPAIVRDVRNAEFPEFIRQMETDYYVNNYIDPVGKKHVFEILSAGVAIPVSVDRIYSSKVTGTEVVGG